MNVNKQPFNLGADLVISDEHGKAIATTAIGSYPQERRRAAGEFLCRAGNSHDELVQLLRAADNKLQGMLAYHCGERAMAIEAFRAKIATALAKADAA